MSTQPLKDKTALITGSISGIGLGIARALAADGANIVFNGFGVMTQINVLIASVAQEFSIKTAYSGANMSKPEQIALMMNESEQQFGGIDILVNNAGIQHVANIEDFPIEK